MRLLGLSNGRARDANDPGYEDPSNAGGKGYASAAPLGLPEPSAGCPGAVPGTPNDPIALELTIRVPMNAHGFMVDSNSFATDWPVFVCSQYDDAFFAMVTPFPPGQTDGQIAYYPNGDGVSLNGAPFDVCSCMNSPPCTAGMKTYACAQGDTQLAGTGLEGNAATGWQTTQAPAPGGQDVVVRIGVYDAGDGIVSATGLVDAWRWITTPNPPVQTVSTP